MIQTSAPTRIDLAGGTIDIWPLYLFHDGAQTINAAISIRARATIERRDDATIVLHSEDTNQRVEFSDLAALATSSQLRLLSLLVDWFLRGPQAPPHARQRGLTLTTCSESPAGAGLAGSSALNVAVCAALAEWTRHHYEPEALLEVAKNVEARAINVPTGLQDYRPALYGGLSAIELKVDGVNRVPLDVDMRELERRIVLCYTASPGIREPTTGKSRSATWMATRMCSTASSGFATRRHGCGTRSFAKTGPTWAAPSTRNGRTASGWPLASRHQSSTP